MRIRGWGASDVGRKREVNEDAFVVDETLGVFAVSDGLGGHAAGERASRLAVDTLRDSVRDARRAGPADPDHATLRRWASEAVLAACAAVHGEATEDPDMAGMACTMTLLLVDGRRAAMAHVGDTRLYLCREGSSWQLSSDHTMAADMVRRGELTNEKARGHPYSSALTRALGAQATVEVETLVLDVLPDDAFLLCSDGLSHYLEGPGEITSALSPEDPSGAPEKLVEEANARGGHDNVTVLVVLALAEEGDEEASGSEDVRIALHHLRRLPGFEGVRFADVLRLLHVAEVKAYRGGESVALDGAELRAFLLPLVGELELTEEDGTTRSVGAGEALGLTSLLLPKRAPRAVRAASDLRLLSLHGSVFAALVRRRPSFGVRLLAALADQLAEELPVAPRAEVSCPPSRWDPRTWFGRGRGRSASRPG